MQGLTTLIQANLTLIDQIDRNGAASSLTLALDNIRKLLNEISNLNFLEKPYLDSQRGQDYDLSALELDRPPKIYQSLLRVITSKDTQILANSEAGHLIGDHDEEDSRTKTISELYESLVDQIKNRWNLEEKQKLGIVLEEDQQEEIYKEMGIEDFKDILRELQNELNYMIRDKNEKQIDTDAKSKKKSLEEVHHGEFQQKSSVRSLLTEKLKNLQPINNEDDLSCIDGKILVKSNWIMKEMKENSRGNVTQPINNLSSNASEGSLSQNVYSVGLYPSNLLKGASKTRFQAQRAILKEINFDMPLPNQKKTKKEKSGCAQCDIY